MAQDGAAGTSALAVPNAFGWRRDSVGRRDRRDSTGSRPMSFRMASPFGLSSSGIRISGAEGLSSSVRSGSFAPMSLGGSLGTSHMSPRLKALLYDAASPRLMDQGMVDMELRHAEDLALALSPRGRNVTRLMGNGGAVDEAEVARLRARFQAAELEDAVGNGGVPAGMQPPLAGGVSSLLNGAGAHGPPSFGDDDLFHMTDLDGDTDFIGADEVFAAEGLHHPAQHHQHPSSGLKLNGGMVTGTGRVVNGFGGGGGGGTSSTASSLVKGSGGSGAGSPNNGHGLTMPGVSASSPPFPSAISRSNSAQGLSTMMSAGAVPQPGSVQQIHHHHQQQQHQQQQLGNPLLMDMMRQNPMRVPTPPPCSAEFLSDPTLTDSLTHADFSKLFAEGVPIPSPGSIGTVAGRPTKRPSTGAGPGISTGTSTIVGTGTSTSGNRDVHNALERERRVNLRRCFDTLREIIPALQDNPKAPSLLILQEATTFVRALQDEDRRLTAAVAELRQKNQSLRSRCQAKGIAIPAPVKMTAEPVVQQQQQQLQQQQQQTAAAAYGKMPPPQHQHQHQQHQQQQQQRAMSGMSGALARGGHPLQQATTVSAVPIPAPTAASTTTSSASTVASYAQQQAPQGPCQCPQCLTQQQQQRAPLSGAAQTATPGAGAPTTLMAASAAPGQAPFPQIRNPAQPTQPT